MLRFLSTGAAVTLILAAGCAPDESSRTVGAQAIRYAVQDGTEATDPLQEGLQDNGPPDGDAAGAEEPAAAQDGLADGPAEVVPGDGAGGPAPAGLEGGEAERMCYGVQGEPLPNGLSVAWAATGLGTLGQGGTSPVASVVVQGGPSGATSVRVSATARIGGKAVALTPTVLTVAAQGSATVPLNSHRPSRSM